MISVLGSISRADGASKKATNCRAKRNDRASFGVNSLLRRSAERFEDHVVDMMVAGIWPDQLPAKSQQQHNISSYLDTPVFNQVTVESQQGSTWSLARLVGDSLAGAQASICSLPITLLGHLLPINRPSKALVLERRAPRDIIVCN